MSSTRLRRSSGLAPAFTLIELLVVVAIIALLVSILLPSLSRAREQAKAAVCAANNHNVGQSCMIYMGQYRGDFPLNDPFPMNPYDPSTGISGIPGTSWPARGGGSASEKFDPVHGYIALYANEIPSDVPVEKDEPWEEYPFGFRVQSQYEPDSLWEGFYCPSQNRRNTIEDNSPERVGLDHDLAAEKYKYASGYMPNRMLRGATINGRGPTKPSKAALPENFSTWDNAFTTPYVYLDHPDLGRDYFFLQASTLDQVVAPADCVYMADSLDYMARRDELVDDRFSTDPNSDDNSAGSWFELTEGPSTVVLGARHLGKAQVLYADGHSDRENQVPRNKRGGLVTATTFADFIEEDGLGNQHHVMPCWRKYK